MNERKERLAGLFPDENQIFISALGGIGIGVIYWQHDYNQDSQSYSEAQDQYEAVYVSAQNQEQARLKLLGETYTAVINQKDSSYIQSVSYDGKSHGPLPDITSEIANRKLNDDFSRYLADPEIGKVLAATTNAHSRDEAAGILAEASVQVGQALKVAQTAAETNEPKEPGFFALNRSTEAIGTALGATIILAAAAKGITTALPKIKASRKEHASFRESFRARRQLRKDFNRVLTDTGEAKKLKKDLRRASLNTKQVPPTSSAPEQKPR